MTEKSNFIKLFFNSITSILITLVLLYFGLKIGELVDPNIAKGESYKKIYEEVFNLGFRIWKFIRPFLIIIILLLLIEWIINKLGLSTRQLVKRIENHLDLSKEKE